MDEPRKASDVSSFLLTVKRTITRADRNCYGWVLVNRRENLKCMADLGFTRADLESTLLELTVVDYCGGPVADVGMPGEMWIFGKAIGSKEVYVKLKLAKLGPLAILRVVSFHFAQKPLSYPYKQ